MRLTRNVGTADRIVRFAAAALLAAAAVTGIATGPLAIVAWVVAGVLTVTGLLGSCPLYQLFGFSSCPIQR